MSKKLPNFKRTKLSWENESPAAAPAAQQRPARHSGTEGSKSHLYTTRWQNSSLVASVVESNVLCIGLGQCPFNLPDSWLYARISDPQQLEGVLQETGWPRVVLISDGSEQSTALALALLQSDAVPAKVTFLRRQAHASDAGLYGLARTARHERPTLSLNCVTVGEHLDSLWPVVCLNDAEQDLLIDDQGQLKVPKLSRVTLNDTSITLSAEKSYVISGGAGDLGLAAAQRLVDLGARHLVLINRSDHSQSASSALKGLQINAKLTLVACDIADGFRLTRTFRDLFQHGLPPVAGVIHTAGVLTDCVLETQTPEQFQTSFDIKVNGAINLRSALQPSDFFIGYGSLAGELGSPGQASYAAANAALNVLMAQWQQTDFAAVAINWGTWSSGGMAVRTGAVQRAEQLGLGSIDAEMGGNALQAVLANSPSQASVIVSPFDWSKISLRTPFLDAFVNGDQAPPASHAPVQDSTIRKLIREAVYEALGEIIDDDQPLMENGLNSLGSMSLRNQIAMSLNVTLPSAFVVECPDINSMVRHVVGLTGTAEVGATSAAVEDSELPVLVIGAGIGGLSFARQLELAGLQVEVVDKQRAAGGVWNLHANVDSKLQIDSPAYDFDSTQLPLDTDHRWQVAFPAQPKIHEDSNRIAQELNQPVRYQTEVTAIEKTGEQEYQVRFLSNDVTSEKRYSGVVSMTGGLHTPKRHEFPQEASFLGAIAYGIGNDLSREKFNGANVVIVGHGAFALENMRTALENGANHVTILCRRRNLVMSTFCNWLLNSAPGVMSVSDVMEVMRPFYRATGINIDDLPSFTFDDAGERVLDQTTVPPGSDLFFLAQMAGKVSVVVDEIESVNSRGVTTKQGQQLSADILLKCLGFSTEPRINQLFGEDADVQGLWINGDANLFTYNDGAQVPRQVKTLLCSSYAFFVQVFAKAYIHFRRHPDLFKSALRRIGNDQQGKTVAERIFMELWDFIEPAKKLTAQRTQELLPFDRFIVEREREWQQYSELLGLSSSSMWSLLRPVHSILARRLPSSPLEQRTQSEKFGQFSVFTPRKKRVLFLPGQGTNGRLARSLLERTGWLARTDLEFTVPDAPFELPAFTNEEQLRQVGLDGLVSLGVYDRTATYREWRAGFETLWAEFHGNSDPAEPIKVRKNWNYSLGYLHTLLDKYGPFDGVAGFCEGAAILTTALHLEAMGADYGLKDIQFFLAISPWQPPLFVKDGLFDEGLSFDLPVLQIVGDNDMPVFIEAAPKFARSFTNLIAYHHPGQHVYPPLNSSLSSKVDELLMMGDRYKIAYGV